MSKIVGPERDALILEIMKRLHGSKLHANGEAWDRNWEQTLADFRANPSEEALVPKFIRNEPVRMDGAFWSDVSELEYVRGGQSWLAEELRDCDSVYEFGCGTGFNLVALARKMPDKAYVGLDRSPFAEAIVREAAEKLGLPILSGRFDLLEPKGKLPPNCGVFTFGAIEQVTRFHDFIEWLIEQRVQKVVHIEPVPELLDENNLLDWLSLEFHKKRGYSRGLLPYLQSRKSVEVLHVKRSNFGSLMLESYARIVWRPSAS